jgi:hypothetical protein
MPINKEKPAHWRIEADSCNPAGPLFGSAFGAADIICETGTTSGYCGTACTWSRTRECC